MAACLLLVLAALVAAEPHPAIASAESASLERARQLLAEGKLTEAQRAADAFVRREPRNSEAHYWRAKVLLQRGEGWEAIRAARRAVAIADTSAKYHLLVGDAWRQGISSEWAGPAATAAKSRRAYEAALAHDSTIIEARRGLLWLATQGLEKAGEAGGPRRQARVVLQEIPRGEVRTVRGPGLAMGVALATFLDAGPMLALQIILLVTGLIVGLARIRDSVAFSFAMACVLTACLAGSEPPLVALWPPAMSLWLLLAPTVASPLVLYFWIRLVAEFPHRSRLGQLLLRWRWAIILPFVPTYLVVGAFVLGILFPAMDAVRAVIRESASLRAVMEMGQRAFQFALSALVGAVLIAQYIEMRGRSAPRLRVLGVALGITMVSLLLGSLEAWVPWPQDRRAAILLYSLWNWISPVGVLIGLGLVAWTVLSHRVFGIRVMIRRGLQSLLLSRGVIVVEALLVLAAALPALARATDLAEAPVPLVAGFAAGGTLLIATGLRRVNRPLMALIDRRFFTDAWDARRVLLGLGEQVSNLADRDRILDRAGDSVMAALHPARVVVLQKGADGSWSSVWGRVARSRVAGDSTVEGDLAEIAGLTGPFAALASGRSWVENPLTRRDSDAGRDADGPAPLELLVALRSGEDLWGCIALAGKLSEEAYSGEDRELLQAVSAQVGMALKNAELIEVARREAQQSRDLEIASRVQQNLFPRSLPSPAGWDLAARCRPARAVGGDYYDLFEISPTKIALALGDVAGKGLGASLLTASLHAMVRGGLHRRSEDLGGLMEEINTQLVASTPPEIFATLFLGVLDTERGVLRYVNAGHPSPVLVHPDRDLSETLETGGTLVGMLEEAEYAEGSATLPQGGTLLIYSDGVSEATDPHGAMFEEQRIVATLQEVRPLGAEAGLQRVLEAVDTFVAGAGQSDDISLIVLRRCGGEPMTSTAFDSGEGARAG
jgi:serine phosphatase RsbU (regulator of sigma subunit)